MTVALLGAKIYAHEAREQCKDRRLQVWEENRSKTFKEVVKSSPSETADDALSLAVLIFFTVKMISPDTLSLLAYKQNGSDIFF